MLAYKYHASCMRDLHGSCAEQPNSLEPCHANENGDLLEPAVFKSSIMVESPFITCLLKGLNGRS